MKTSILTIVFFAAVLIYMLCHTEEKKALEAKNIEKAKDRSNKVINYRKDTILPLSTAKFIGGFGGNGNIAFGYKAISNGRYSSNALESKVQKITGDFPIILGSDEMEVGIKLNDNQRAIIKQYKIEGRIGCTLTINNQPVYVSFYKNKY
ncbi:hypothetical protein KAU11_08970 [Candidatus Babeliales bacterium]|nr:hypothetical protein [Candidatus Babeliales bacterium]